MTPIILLFSKLIQIYEYIIFIRIILSWIQLDPYNPLVQFIAKVTDPLLDAVRKAFPFLASGGLDFSPILVFILLEATRKVLFRLL